MALSDYTITYRGITLAPNTTVKATAIRGIEGFNIRVADKVLPNRDGAIRGADYVGSKIIELEIAVVGDYSTNVPAILAAFSRNNNADDRMFFKTVEREESYIVCRPVTRVKDLTAENSTGIRRFAVQLIAADPRIYGATLQQTLLNQFSASLGGVDFGIDLSFDFTGTLTSTIGILTNEGDADAWPRIVFNGPSSGTLTAVLLENLTNGSSIEITSNVLSTQQIIADMEAYITANGNRVIELAGSNIYGAWEPPRTGFYLSPGENEVKYTPTGTVADATVNVYWRNTSI